MFFTLGASTFNGYQAHQLQQSYKWLSYSWSQCLRMMARSELHAILRDVLSSFAATYILHDDPRTPLTLAHAKYSYGAVATPTADVLLK